MKGTARGREVVNEMGEKAYMLDDGYRVLDDIKGTPRYWKKTKYEMIKPWAPVQFTVIEHL